MRAPSQEQLSEPVLRVRALRTHFPVRSGLLRRRVGQVRAVDGIDLEIHPGQTLGLVGESGGGKSTAARSVLRLIEPTSGSIELGGREITSLSRAQLVPIRRHASLVFQDPYSSLNPRHTVGRIVGAPFEVHRITPPGGVRAQVQSLLERVGLDPEAYHRFPDQFSGGQRQRIAIARAVALAPRLVICDEPVSALDVSIQAQVLNLLRDLQGELGLSYLLIAHDLAVVRRMSDRIAVMYLGKIVESAPSEQIQRAPRHPYTKALLSAVLLPDPARRGDAGRITLNGEPPSALDPPSGCVFRTRCWKAQPRCATEEPQLSAASGGDPQLSAASGGDPQLSAASGGDGHRVACHFPEPAGDSEPGTGQTGGP